MKTSLPLDALCFAFGMVVFGLCAHREALLIPRILGILVAVFALARAVAKHRHTPELFGLTRFPRYRFLYTPLAIGLGAGLGVYYRLIQQRAPLPEHLTLFCLLAAAIGICEEAAYRGFIQGRLRGYGWVVACAGAAVAHTAYKCSLFVFPSTAVRANMLWLGIGTFLFGFLFGAMREGFGSVLFPVLGHVGFDVVAYGDLHAAPWWV